ncbi:MAG: chromate efflux transporter [Pseudomonadota bacterium]
MSAAPHLGAALGTYTRIGLLSFGGPAGQIALMQSELVDRRGWVAADAFQRGLNVAMLLPGPEAQQLVTWLGWRLHGMMGGLIAGLAFILPGAALMILLAWIAAAYGETRWVAAIFYGVQPAVIALVAHAVWKLSRRSLSGTAHWLLAAAAFVGIFVLGVPFPAIVALSALAGFLLPAPSVPEIVGGRVPRARHWLRVVAVAVTLVVAVFLAARTLVGTGAVDEVAELFTTAAFVSFGGAYALLPYVADRAVESYGWLTAAEMLNGLALAESTPGPLILVNVYAGFYAGWPEGAQMGALTAALACFYTFAPSFMLILAIAPYVEAVQRLRWVRRALAGVSAAVVGVVLNLAVYLTEAAIFPAGLLSPDWLKLALLIGFGLWVIWRQPAMTLLVAVGAASGLLLSLVGAIGPGA